MDKNHHLLLELPFAKQEGEVTKQGKKRDQELVTVKDAPVLYKNQFTNYYILNSNARVVVRFTHRNFILSKSFWRLLN